MPAGARPTGIKEFDNGPLMNVSGMPTWQMLVTDRGISTTGTEGNWNEFGGFVAFDTAGFVVWYYDLPNDMYGCNWERLADGDFVFSVESTPSGFVQVDPLHNMKKGHLVSECDSITSTSALGYQMLNHEALINSWAENEPILTFRSEAVNLSAAIEADDNTYRFVKTDAVVEWDRSTDEISTLLELTDFFDPYVYQPGDAQTGYATIKCGGEPDAEDWSHANSISLDADGNLIVGIRNLNAVAAFRVPWGSKRRFSNESSAELLWIVSNNSAWSNFTFDDDSSKFFMAHHVRARTDVTAPNQVFLTMFDNGDSRPECNFMADPHQPDMHCYSRGLEIMLDLETKVAKKVWQYTPPAGIIGGRVGSLFAKAKGSVEILNSENRLVGFTAALNRNTGVVGEWWAFEADKNGTTVAWMYLSPCWKTNWEYPYRALSLGELLGESSERPSLYDR